MTLLLMTNFHNLSLHQHTCMLLILPPPSMHLTLPSPQHKKGHYHLYWLTIHFVLYPPTPLLKTLSFSRAILDHYILKVRTRFSGTLENTRPTRQRHIPEDTTLQHDQCQNLERYTVLCDFAHLTGLEVNVLHLHICY
jgi:hypothetical protein